MNRVKLKDVAVEVKGKHESDGCAMTKTVGLEHLTPGDIDLQNWAEDADTTFTKGFEAGDILFGRRRAYQKKAAIAPFNGVCSGDITVIRAREGAIDRGLLPFIIQNDRLFDFAMGKSAGSMSPRVKWSSLGEFEFVLPDAEKQHEIARVLWAIQELHRVYKAIIRESENVIKSRFVEMFGDPATNPFGFSTAGLTELGTCKNGMNFHSSDSGVELPCLGVADFKDLSFIDGVEGLSTVSLNERPSEDYLLNDGDIVFVRSNGNKQLVGRCLAIYPHGVDAVFSGFCIRLRLNNDDVRVPYLVWALKQPTIRSQMFGRGANVQNLNQKILSNVCVPIPSIEMQDEFLAFASQVDKSKFATQNALDSLDATSSAILNEELGLEND